MKAKWNTKKTRDKPSYLKAKVYPGVRWHYIELSVKEYQYKSGYQYIYKIKVPKATAHTRIFGRIKENGEIIFELII